MTIEYCCPKCEKPCFLMREFYDSIGDKYTKIRISNYCKNCHYREYWSEIRDTINPCPKCGHIGIKIEGKTSGCGMGMETFDYISCMNCKYTIETDAPMMCISDDYIRDSMNIRIWNECAPLIENEDDYREKSREISEWVLEQRYEKCRKMCNHYENCKMRGYLCVEDCLKNHEEYRKYDDA